MDGLYGFVTENKTKIVIEKGRLSTTIGLNCDCGVDILVQAIGREHVLMDMSCLTNSFYY